MEAPQAGKGAYPTARDFAHAVKRRGRTASAKAHDDPRE